MKKIMVLDTETTGLDTLHGIIQIAGSIEINKRTEEEFDILCNICPNDKVNAKALEVNGRTLDEISSFQPAMVAKAKFDKMMQRFVNKFDKADKFYMVGYNTGFDHMMMNGWYKKHNDNYMMSYFFYPIIDVAQMAALHMEHTGEKCRLANFKLGTLGIYLGFIDDTSQLHNALADIRLTRDIFYTCLGASYNVQLKDHAEHYRNAKEATE